MNKISDEPGSVIILNPIAYTEVASEFRRNASAYGGQVQWKTPHSFDYRGARVIKG